MRLTRVVFIGMFAFVPLMHGAMAQKPKDGVWQKNFEAAEKMARRQALPMLIHFHADWCGPCRAMERNVLQTAEVRQAIASGIVAVKVNSDLRRDLARRFGISSLPSDVIMASDGRVLSQSVGSPGRSGYVAKIKQHRRPASEVSAEAVVSRVEPTVPAPASQNSEHPALAAAVQTSESESGDSEMAAVADQAPKLGNARPSQPATAVVDVERPKLTKVLRRELNKQIGLDGYSPVALFDSSQWKRAAKIHKREYLGVCYLLGSIDELQRFQHASDRFVPALHGFDPVTYQTEHRLITGAIELGVRFRNRIYFFANEANRDLFLSVPRQFSETTELTFSLGGMQTDAEL